MVTPKLSFNEQYMNISLTSSSGTQGGSVLINNTIDYSKYTKLNIKYTATLGKYNNAETIQLYKNSNNISADNYITQLCYENVINTETIKTIDISQINNFNDFYIYVQAHSNQGTVNCNIYEVWLEK